MSKPVVYVDGPRFVLLAFWAPNLIVDTERETARIINWLAQIYGRTQISIRRLHGEPRNQQDG